VPRSLDFRGLDEIFTWWTTAPPRTAFEGINELAPGANLEVRNGKVVVGDYWRMEYPEEFDHSRSLDSWAEELHALLVDAVRLRLRADVPVGAYLSGGLDSSATTSLIKNFTSNRIETFSIAFHDKAYDESAYQLQMAEFLGTNHHQIQCGYRDIAENFPVVIWHTERPILRTAAAPLYMLSGLVRQNNFKVVLTGEGSDEILGGYDIFKETMIRWFWSKKPDSASRPLLLQKLYPTLPLSASRAKFYLETFYRAGLGEIDKYYFSHIPRINTTTRIKDYFVGTIKEKLCGYDALTAFEPHLSKSFFKWHHLARAQYLEARSLLSGYLLSSQGDRVTAGHSVEGRFPFLDPRVVELGTRIPPWHKILGLKEKLVLKRAMRGELPKEITARVKQPYMAPDSNSFMQADSPEYIREMFSPEVIKRFGVFEPGFVGKLYEKCRNLSHAHLSFKDNMSFIGILSTQLLIDQYIDHFRTAPGLKPQEFKIWQDQSSL
jgi:asparagine synthase (glutamine-hydrolysing)